ncbi:DNA repair and recombination protein RAD26 [Magnaporthiopsis poae ATCC 64411]|uniref:DNA repair and recombination protein RAD26 n=1 Tax=Magnaporthiopsis poae (strain ATCC 64411 / 73-15) TaxID=644358 RepID=A0A0C4E6J8_MAGP6|nr:DNA repair and recombination protein RAD26 [Magnaporthiopsis poae ATCC 64411]
MSAVDEAQLDEAAALAGLTENVRDQDELARDITHRANLALIDAEDEKDQKRIVKAEADQKKLSDKLKALLRKAESRALPAATIQRTRTEIEQTKTAIAQIDRDILDLSQRIQQRHREDGGGSTDGTKGTKKLTGETQRDYLIRTGKITPFAKIGGPRPEGVEGELADAIIEAEDEAAAVQLEKADEDRGPRSHQNLRAPGFADGSEPPSAAESEFSLRPRKKRKIAASSAASDDDFQPSSGPASPEDAVSDAGYDSADMTVTPVKSKRKRAKKSAAASEDDEVAVDLSGIDDGNEGVYRKRLSTWVERRRNARLRRQIARGEEAVDDKSIDEWFKPSPDQPDHEFDNGLKLPGDIYPALFDYQKTGVRWLSELFEQNVGGIVGDEMGLGKTVQLISFVAALHYSRKLTRPVIVVAPATLLQQWVNEFHRWWPPLRVSILHSSGSGMLDVRSEGRLEDEELSSDDEEGTKKKKGAKAAKKIVDRVVKDGHVLVTTYAGLQAYGGILIPVEWDYAVLDEGHKIRNPNTALTVYCKELRTANRIILSGTPIQNNLVELWSLFDFIYPMRLGTLHEFRNNIEIPIRLGGYANATNLQIMTAQKCAETLKDAISPYLLQRVKADVAADLPKKSEQVLFCKLTQIQRSAYEQFLSSKEMDQILNGTRKSFFGIDQLRKVCNHPDLLDPTMRGDPSYRWGSASKSGKMQVVKALLHMWKRFGHKTLLFSQGTQMLDILEAFVRRQDGIRYLRMDGRTPIKERQALVDQFNNVPELDVFLLTTKVGGLGVNLTGADRVIIFDPDWNPSTDVQARERAWRLGQKKEVTIYRLMTAGTIEEKIYQRQIFKQFLTNKVLKDPSQRNGFATMQDLHNLFTLASYEEGNTETGKMFKDSQVKASENGGDRAGGTPATKTGEAGGPTSVIAPGSDAYLLPSHPFMQGGPSAKPNEQEHNKDDDAELRGIAGVAGLEAFKDTTASAPVKEEDRIIEGIFSRSVHSALEHDNIMDGPGGSKKPQASREFLRREAERIAADAAASLRRAEEQARTVEPGRVTWTGEVGEVGRPGGGSNVRLNDFIRMIPPFMRRHGGQTASKALVDHFNQWCVTNQQSNDFKEALRRVAVLDKQGSTMRGIWKLKPEFRNSQPRFA